MFGIGLPEFIVILVLALLVFGPKKLPELGQTLGAWISGLRNATQEISNEVKEILEPRATHKDLSVSERGEEKRPEQDSDDKR